jgi:hypothetical protein
MTVKELIDKLQQFDEDKLVLVANGLYVIRKAGSNRAGFIKFND